MTNLTVYNNGTTDGVAAANSGFLGADCSSVGVWVEGVPNDVTGIACGDSEGGSNASAGKKEYSFFDLNKSVKPFVLTPGDTDADPNYDGSTKAKRPKELLDIKLLKKTIFDG